MTRLRTPDGTMQSEKRVNGRLKWKLARLAPVLGIMILTHELAAQGLSRGYVGQGAFGPRIFGQSVGGPTRSLFGPRTLGRPLGGPANASYFGPRYLGAGVGGVALYPALQFQAAPGVVVAPNFIPGFPAGSAPLDGQVPATMAGPPRLTAPLAPAATSPLATPAPPPLPAGPSVNPGATPPTPPGGANPVSNRRPPVASRFQADRAAQGALSTRFAPMLQRVSQLRATGPVSVTIQGRTAVLTGVVDSSETRSLLERIARMEPGVSNVRNELRVGSD